STVNTYGWSGYLFPGDCDTFFLPLITSINGVHTFTARVDSVNINSGDTDIDTSNNYKTNSFTLSGSNTIVYDTVCESLETTSGLVITTSGTYYDTLNAISGCDSIVELIIKINNASTDTIDYYLCDSLISITGKVWKTPGIYYDTILNTSGCDSILVYNLSATFLSASQMQKLVASDREGADQFGFTVSVSGNFAVVGSIFEDQDTAGANVKSKSGSAYIYELNSMGNWVQKQKIVASDRDVNDYFGCAVAISGNYIVVGAYSEDQNAIGGSTKSGAGSAYIFERNGSGVWIQKQKIVASNRDNSDYFGFSVDVDRNTAIIGARQTEFDSLGTTIYTTGSAYFFERNSGGVWIETQQIYSSDRRSGDGFGCSVSINENSAIIGAYTSDPIKASVKQSDAGSAYIFEKDTGGTWVETANLVADDLDVSDRFGHSVSIDGNYAVVGARYEDHDTSNSNYLIIAGSAYVYSKDGTGNWSQQQKIVASDRDGSDEFGFSVSISGNKILVGANKEDHDASGGNSASGAGSAYLYELKTIGGWNQISKIVASDRQSSDLFASSVSLDGNTMIFGASGEDHDTSGLNSMSDAGSAYIFEIAYSNSSIDSLTLTECDSFVSISGNTYSATGIYYDTIITSNGCDSVVKYDLTIISINDTNIYDTICADETFTLTGGSIVSIIGIYRDTLLSVNGCDSIVITNLHVKDTTSSLQTITMCDSLISPSGKIWRMTGIYNDTITNSEGCDSLMTFDLTISTVYRDTLVEVKCDSSITWRGNTYTTNSFIHDTVSGTCDSIFTLDYTRYPTYAVTISDTVCDSVTVMTGRYVDSTGTYRDTLSSVNGCDSIFIFNILVNNSDTAIINITTCDSLISPSGTVWKVTGIYLDTISTTKGCDSLMTFDLTISTVYRDTLIEVKCDSSITWRGNTYSTNTFIHDTVNSAVCDSIFTLDYTKNSSFISTINYIVCDSVTVFTGRFIDSSGTYDDTLTTINGCDSIYRFIVMINNKDTSTQNVTTCDSLISPSGKVWKSTGVYYDTITTASGCDSLITFNLTISTTTIVNNPTIKACDSIQINGVWYSASQSINDTITSPGCDTVKITPIIINTGTWSISTLTICDSMTSGSGKVYKNSGFFRDTMPNSKGCDSLVEYYLTVNRGTISNKLITACGSHTSPTGNIYTASGSYSDTLSTSLGCDSIINTFLIIDTVVRVTLDSIICFGDSVVLSNGTKASSTGIYYDTVFGSIPSSLIYSEDFQGATYSFTLNTNDTNAITPGNSDNAWIINNSYLGGSVFGSPIINTPNQDVAVTGNVNSTYLHIYNKRSAALSFPSITNSNYIDVNISLLGGQSGLNFSKMTNDISTVGKSHVSFEMYYLCRGSFGRFYYSLNSGTTWNRIGGQINNGGQNWSHFSLVDSVFANQPTIRFAVGFNNTDGLGVSPGFAVDEIEINGIGASSSNCDSITTINLTVSPLIDTNLYDTICRGQSITLSSGMTVSVSGIYRDTLTASSGCDSVIITDLLVHDTTQSTISLRECDSVISPSGKVWKASGSYIDSISNSVGCDSVIYISVVIDTVVITRIDTSICQGDSIFFKDVGFQNSSGLYISTYSTLICDSLVWYNLTVINPIITNRFDTICANQSFTLPSGGTVNTAGIYRDTLSSFLNCDSVIITNLFVGDTSTSNPIISTCDSLISPSGKIWKTSGIYLDTIANVSGCDSLMTINLTITSTTFINESDTACDSLIWRLQTINTSGLYYDTITTGVCDTIYVLDLLINNSYTNNNPVVSCDSFTLPGGTTVYLSGLYNDTLITISGCDSIINSNVTITTASTSNLSETNCGDYTSPSGKVFTTTGIYNDTITNSGGCDSIITINLTILTSTSVTVLANGCDTFSLPGGTIATATGVYTDTLINGNGCDSIIITNLIIGYSSNVTQNFSLCAGETVTVGTNVYGATGIYSDTFATALGCDSIINTNLLINPLTPGVITFTQDMCEDAAVVLFTATPTGGYWKGPGIDSATGFFDPALAGAGIYTITYTGPGPCGRTDSATVEVYSVPTITFNLTDDECDEGSGAIDVTIIGGTPTINYTWSNGEITEDLTAIKEGIYTLSVVDVNGCSSSETMSIINVSNPDCDYSIFVPNVFSPDGNGENDVLKVEGNGIETIEFSIFNRWGNLIFSTTSADVGWDGSFKGQPVNQGAFVCFVRGTFVDGNEFEEKGTVTVIRR
ncbi:gliding motility-associated C-terminal domain-containing protein, partial [Flavobacteriales bacterium]|nr:gliding motility-associated C-terminal domain-containing protein [Flavobacteriales bacterium]